MIFFSCKEVGTGTGTLFNFFLIVQSLHFIGAGAGAKNGAVAGDKNTRSRSKTDRLRNTAQVTIDLNRLRLQG